MSATQERPATAPTRAKRGPYATTPARRIAIVEAASASFAEHGYERSSLRDIAARANVTHAALLRHFASKDELLLAALARRDEQDEELARRIMESKVSAERVLTSVLREEFEHPEMQRNWLAITVAATNPDHPAHAFFLARRDKMRANFASGRLETALDHDELSADDKVTMVLAMIDGLRIQALLDPDRTILPLLERFMRLIATTQPAEANATQAAGGI
ncbi:helix-turn-helix domain-containing protein [Microbacterium sp. NPDC089180]|uniref:TetR/AcrR family transcriptional regulator n=1 Tax=Microbacterium TaxID=33882 RepID=UPI002782876B|nr:TetR/AcrR family transcriptional regulator [Microbacterium testaceum]MDQ1174976.1 AcrR family transcriptional regulator [Microbacterium testaceum]